MNTPQYAVVVFVRADLKPRQPVFRSIGYRAIRSTDVNRPHPSFGFEPKGRMKWVTFEEFILLNRQVLNFDWQFGEQLPESWSGC